MHSFAQVSPELTMHGTPRWSLLLLMVIAVGVLAVALSNPRARRVLIAIIGAGAVLVLMAMMVWFGMASGPAEMAAHRVPTPDEETIPISQAEMAAERPATSSKEPDWIHKTDPRVNREYVVISSGELADPSMVNEILDAKMAAAAESRVSYLLGEPNMAEKLHIDATYIRNGCIAGKYDADDNGRSETFLRLKFDGKFDTEVKRRYKEYLSTSRVEKLGGATLGVLGVIAAALVVLRFTKPREEPINRGG